MQCFTGKKKIPVNKYLIGALLTKKDKKTGFKYI